MKVSWWPGWQRTWVCSAGFFWVAQQTGAVLREDGEPRGCRRVERMAECALDSRERESGRARGLQMGGEPLWLQLSMRRPQEGRCPYARPGLEQATVCLSCLGP